MTRINRTREAALPLEDFGGAAYAAVRPLGVPTEEQLQVINENHARKPLEEDEVYVFEMEISNDLQDSYHTRMDPDTTLKNYVEDFKEGRSLQNSHNSGELGIGRSFDARLEERGTEGSKKDPPRTAVVVSDYIQRGIQLGRVHNDHVISGIDGGTIKDGSIRFTGEGEYRCSVCNGDMADMFGECTHVPGVEYGDGGKRTVAYANIIGDHASEHSLVFDGATPRAMVDKAQRMVGIGKLSERQIRQFESNTNTRIRRPARSKSVKRDKPTSFEDIKSALQDAIAKNYDSECYVYLVVTNADTVAYEVNSGDESGTYQATYAIDATGNVTLGEPTEVTVTTTVTQKVAPNRNQPTNGGINVDPKAIAALVGLPEAERSTLYSLAVDVLGDELTPEFVRSVGDAIKARDMGVTPESVDTALAVLDQKNAVPGDTLQSLVKLEPPEVEPPAVDPPATTPPPVRASTPEDAEKALVGLRLIVDSIDEAEIEGETPEESESRSIARSNVQRALRKPEFAGVDNLLREAQAGRRYRNALVKDVHAWGVRAQGTGYDRGLMETLTERATPEHLEILGRQLRDAATTRFAHVKPEDIPEDLRKALGVMLGSVGRQTEALDPTAPPANGGQIAERVDASQFKTPAPGR